MSYDDFYEDDLDNLRIEDVTNRLNDKVDTEEHDLILTDLLECYSSGGASAVYEYARYFHPEWKWASCPSCDDLTPTFDGACAVCWEDRNV